MSPFIRFLKDSNQLIDVVVQSLFWMVASLVAAYPDFCLYGNISMFCTSTRNDYCDEFLIPIILFLMAFIGDFYFTIKDLAIGLKRGYLFKSLTILICLSFILLLAITVTHITSVKIIFFILLWLNISFIKGLTVLIPGAEEDVILKRPSINI